MTMLRKIVAAYALVLLAVACLNYVPGLRDADGNVLGIFALDIYDDALHLVSAIWAGASALHSQRASRLFLSAFGFLYLTDGLLGLVTGSGYLDLGILIHGVQDLPLGFKVLANLPHIGLGGIALLSAHFIDRDAEQSRATA